MRRNYLRRGDRSSVGGLVIEGVPSFIIDGKELAFIGAKVACSACNSLGQVLPQGPRWPGCVYGKMAAFEGDVCDCRCSPPPILLASQTARYQTFTSQHVSDMGFTDEVASNPVFASHIQRILVTDSTTGRPLGNQLYLIEMDGRQQRGYTDPEGYASVFSDGEKVFKIHVVFSAQKRSLTPQQETPDE